MVYVDQAGDCPNRGPVASQLIGVNDLWDIVFTQDPAQERLRGFGIAVTLEQDVEHEAVLDILLSSGQAPRGLCWRTRHSLEF